MGWVFPPISAQELQTWQAFERVDGPILLHDRVETSLAIAAMTFASPYTKNTSRMRLDDFIPRWDPTKSKTYDQSAEEIMDALRSMAIKKYDDGEEETFYDSSGGDVHSQPRAGSRVARER